MRDFLDFSPMPRILPDDPSHHLYADDVLPVRAHARGAQPAQAKPATSHGPALLIEDAADRQSRASISRASIAASFRRFSEAAQKPPRGEREK